MLPSLVYDMIDRGLVEGWLCGSSFLVLASASGFQVGWLSSVLAGSGMGVDKGPATKKRRGSPQS